MTNASRRYGHKLLLCAYCNDEEIVVETIGMGGNIKKLKGVIDCAALKPKLPMTIYRRGALSGFSFPSSKQYALRRDIFKAEEGCQALEKHRRLLICKKFHA